MADIPIDRFALSGTLVLVVELHWGWSFLNAVTLSILLLTLKVLG